MSRSCAIRPDQYRKRIANSKRSLPSPGNRAARLPKGNPMWPSIVRWVWSSIDPQRLSIPNWPAREAASTRTLIMHRIRKPLECCNRRFSLPGLLKCARATSAIAIPTVVREPWPSGQSLFHTCKTQWYSESPLPCYRAGERLDIFKLLSEGCPYPFFIIKFTAGFFVGATDHRST